MQPNWPEQLRLDAAANPYLWRSIDPRDLRGTYEFEDPCPLDERVEPRD